jgi:hypothetical protein
MVARNKTYRFRVNNEEDERLRNWIGNNNASSFLRSKVLEMASANENPHQRKMAVLSSKLNEIRNKLLDLEVEEESLVSLMNKLVEGEENE